MWKFLILGLSVTYPVVIYLLLGNNYSFLAGFLAASIVSFQTASYIKRRGAPQTIMLLTFVTMWATFMVALRAWQMMPILFLPVVSNAVLAIVFSLSLLRPPTIIERFARKMNGNLPPEAVAYCRRVCITWIIFFIGNGLIALDSTQRSLSWWSLYNGLVSYAAIALLFCIEFLIRLRVMKRLRESSQSLTSLCVVLIGALALLFFDPESRADTNPTETSRSDVSTEFLRSILTPQAPFRAGFRERRHIAVLTSALESRGDITVVPTSGLLWHTVEPIDQLIAITPRGLTEFSKGTRIPDHRTPDRANVSRTMLSLLSGRLEETKEEFELVISGSKKAWSITLTPKDALVRDIIGRILVSGSTYPQVVEVFHASGDRIETTFDPPSPLSPLATQEAKETLDVAL